MTRMHSSRMCTARSLPYGGFSARGVSLTETPWKETPLDRDAPWAEPPLTETPCGQTSTCENITFANFVRAIKISGLFDMKCLLEICRSGQSCFRTVLGVSLVL